MTARFECQHMSDCGPGEIWWILDNKTKSFIDTVFDNRFAAWLCADAMNKGRLDRNGQPI